MSQACRLTGRAAAASLIAFTLSACGGGGSQDSPPVATVPLPSPAPAPAPTTPPAAVLACPVAFDFADIIPSASPAPACDNGSYDTFPDVAYAPHGAAVLDLLVPRSAVGPPAIVVWVHGGGWQSGDKSDRAQAQRLACRGYALAAINYRLSDSAVFPAQLHDLKAAVRFLRANASTWNLDGSRIAVFGSSAGGHLAALAGSSGDVADLEDLSLGNAAQSSRIQAVVDWYGPTRLAEMDSQLLAQGCPAGSAHHGAADSPESRLLGCALGDDSCDDAARRADPTQYVDAGDPPHLILHGTADCTSPGDQSVLLAEQFAGAGACAVHRRVVGAGHGGPQWISPEVQEATADFLDAVLDRPAPSPIVVNCGALSVTGDASAPAGARWTYHSTDDGVEYSLSGVLYAPAGAGPFPGVVVSHGFGGSATGYSSNIARPMRDWGMIAIATNYTHAPDGIDAGSLPQGGDGASNANVLRAHKARDLLSCVPGVDMTRLAAHGHSMGAFVTGQLLGTYPGDFRAASHTAGGANDQGANATRTSAAAAIRTPYQLHHGDADTVVALALDQTLEGLLAANRTAHELRVYTGYTHEQVALDTLMLERVREWYRNYGVLPR